MYCLTLVMMTEERGNLLFDSQ